MNISINKVSVNIGVGDSGEKLQKAEKLLEMLLEQKPVRCYSKATHPEFGVKKHAPIGVKVTLRKKKAEDFLKKAFDAIENQVESKQFDSNGNLALGIHEYIELPGAKYDPEIGMFGMDVSINMKKPGFRIAKRKKQQRKIPRRIRVTKEESMKFFQEKFGVKTNGN